MEAKGKGNPSALVRIAPRNATTWQRKARAAIPTRPNRSDMEVSPNAGSAEEAARWPGDRTGFEWTGAGEAARWPGVALMAD